MPEDLPPDTDASPERKQPYVISHDASKPPSEPRNFVGLCKPEIQFSHIPEHSTLIQQFLGGVLIDAEI